MRCHHATEHSKVCKGGGSKGECLCPREGGGGLLLLLWQGGAAWPRGGPQPRLQHRRQCQGQEVPPPRAQPLQQRSARMSLAAALQQLQQLQRQARRKRGVPGQGRGGPTPLQKSAQLQRMRQWPQGAGVPTAGVAACLQQSWPAATHLRQGPGAHWRHKWGGRQTRRCQRCSPCSAPATGQCLQGCRQPACPLPGAAMAPRCASMPCSTHVCTGRGAGSPAGQGQQCIEGWQGWR